MPKMRIIPDCGECESCETVIPAQSSDGRYYVYCSDHRVKPPNRTIWVSPKGCKIPPYPDFRIPDWCQLDDAPEQQADVCDCRTRGFHVFHKPECEHYE